MTTRRRKFWGWGWEDEGLDRSEQERLAALLAARFQLPDVRVGSPPRLEEIELRAPRVRVPVSLESCCTTDPHERLGHSYGKSFRDLVRAWRRQYDNPVDVVALPRSEEQLEAVLAWCDREMLAAIPYGGGSSVVGGVEPPRESHCRGAVSIDLRCLGRVLEVDRVSRAARIQAGVYGPALEEQLRPYGLTLRHFPQSFEFSTLGGWIATRSGGHYATLYTHIDEFVESLRIITPSGWIETRRLPGSGAGPNPDRLWIGSEGILGIITEAWMRVQDRPRFRAQVPVRFPDFLRGAEAVRAIAQAGLYPSNLRLLDPLEALTAGAGDGSSAILVLAFESADHPLDPWMQRALECCRDYGGVYDESAGRTREDPGVTREGAAGAWRQAFLRGPYVRDALVGMGMVSETFETAVTWDRFEALHVAVVERVERALRELCGGGQVSCRFTHAYPDGPAPYYTVIAPGRGGDLLALWDAIKAAASEAILCHGGTITHHHAVGRDHRPWYDRERPNGFAEVLAAAKRVLDPSGILNPGVLIDPKVVRERG
ncbi:MAG: alkyldihydroxyacetonephosphate synthase [Candidatus Binatia bacterium]|nr:MAG: alkyldihydroxyacetonephosphate synthase [Candidatus Binatia bacterium]